MGVNPFPRYDITLKIQSSALDAYEASLWRNFAYIYSIDLTPNETGKCGENVIYTFIKDTGTLTISGSGKMEDYEFGDDDVWDYYDYYMTTPKWYSFRENISNVVIEPGVTHIGNYAFLDCSQMTSIRIPNSVISIGSKAFVGCSALTSISIPEGTQSVWFTGCTSLSSISLPATITSAIFSDRIINEFSGSNIGYRNFNPCKNLETITLPQNISNVEFSGCTSLTSINIPSSVTSIVENAFKNCKNLTTIVIPESILNIGSGAFEGCEKLKSVKIPEGVKNIAQKTFYNCEKLGNISLPSTLNSIDGGAFYNCWALKEIIALSSTPPSADITTFTSYDAVLKVPESAVEIYSKTLPWKNFNIIQTLTNDDLNRQCATPTISYNDGNLEFNCETEGVEYHYNLSAGKSSSLTNSKISLNQNYVISVYASKNGYEDSDPATLEIPHGDINGDGKVDASDTVKLVDLIMKQ